MNPTRIWMIGGSAAVIAVLAGGLLLGVQPQIAAAAATADSATTIDAQNQATMIKITRLSKAAAKLDAFEAENAILLKSVPTVLKPNTFIRRVTTVAALDGVTVSAVNLGDSAAYTAPATAVGDPALALGLTNPAITAANFSAVPVTLEVKGTGAAALQFAHDIQNDERVFAINGVRATQGDAGVVVTSLSGYIYTLKR